MMCWYCKQKEATVHLAKITDGRLEKVHLCEGCAKAKGVNDPTGFSIADLLLGLGSAQELATGTGNAELACPRCGFTQADFEKTGRFGCSGCYDAFASALGELLRPMHHGVRHVGKVPAAFRKPSERLAAMRAKLAAAVGAEQFEQAALLRDEIHRLSAPMASSGS